MNGYHPERVLLIATLFAPTAAWPQDASDRRAPEVIAVVNGVELLSAELELRSSQIPQPDGDMFEAEVARRRSRLLEVLIRQQLVLEYLQRRSRGVTEPEVDRALQRWKQELSQRGETPSEYYAATGLNESAVRRRLDWQLSWPHFVETRLTEDRLQRYFANRRREFDGTRLCVAHILWPAAPDAPSRPAFDRAADVRQSILAGELSFEEAARRYSQAPSAEQGGNIGWIERSHPMDPIFSAAAFGLQANEVSQPVVTPLGVHLIQCLEIEAGRRSFEEVRPEVVRAARQELFGALARRQRKTARIEVR